MTISGVSGLTSYIGSGIVNLHNQLNTLTQQLSSGKISNTYSGDGTGRGLAIGIRNQLSTLSGYTDTQTNVTTRINVANLSLQRLSDISSEVKGAAVSAGSTLDNTGQTAGQKTASLDFYDSVDMLNAQSGDRYLFSGRATNTAPVAPADQIMNGNGAAIAGLKQVIAERQAADLGAQGMGRVILSQPTTTSVQVGEDFAANPGATPPVPASPYGLKLNAISTSIAGATVTQPTATPPATNPPSPLAMGIDLGAATPQDGDTVKFTFNLPDGTTEDINLTASTATPVPANGFAIGATPAATAANMNAALTSAVKTLANGPLVAASAEQAGNDFFDQPPLRVSGTADNTSTGTAVNSALTAPTPINSNTALLNASNTNSLSTGFSPGDAITVSSTSGGASTIHTISFYTGAAPAPVAGTTFVDLSTATIGSLMGTIDTLNGNPPTTPPAAPSPTSSTVTNGSVVLHSGTANDLSITSSNSAALAALGLGSTTTVARTGPTAQVNGTAANTVIWYQGETGTDSARGTAVAEIDTGITVQYGARANEQALRTELQNVAVFAAVTTSATNPNAAAVVSALNQRVANNLATIPGTQTIQDIQADFAGAQASIQSAANRQTQSTAMAQDMLDHIEGVNNDEVATEIMALQTALQASYTTTAQLSQMNLVKYLPPA